MSGTSRVDVLLPCVRKQVQQRNSSTVQYRCSKECFDPWNTGACSMDACRSPDVKAGYDCWAGSDVEECNCSQGEAKLTGESGFYEGKTYHEYTCCTEAQAQATNAVIAAQIRGRSLELPLLYFAGGLLALSQFVSSVATR
ncbi:unnamed protein product [Polarella glacialis]|uniref:Uncharacterized protein n=1 Tax=Polarella glacialis TaxID=89957 RepID=A0A813KG70_POLGL|nr:unnamed protein product [Polarella glacialis]